MAAKVQAKERKRQERELKKMEKKQLEETIKVKKWENSEIR